MPLLFSHVIGIFLALTTGSLLIYHFTSEDAQQLKLSVDEAIEQVSITGISQLSDAGEALLFNQDWQNFDLVRANILMQKILTAYNQEALPQPQVQLDLSQISRGAIRVEVFENNFPEPSAPPVSHNALASTAAVAQIVLPSGNTAQVLTPTATPASASAVVPDPLKDVWVWLDDFVAPTAPAEVKKTSAVKPVKTVSSSAVQRVLSDHEGKSVAPQKTTVKPSAPEGNFFEAVDARAASAAFDRSQIAADNELFLELQIDGKRRLDLFLALLDKDDAVLLPLSEMMRGFGFPVEVDLDAATANGWFVRQENRFYLDVSRQKLEIGQEVLPFPQGQLVVTEEDIYVPLNLIESWFPFKLDVAYNDLILYATSTLTLPEKAAAERRKIWLEIEKNRADTLAATSVSSTIFPYGKFYLPSARLSLGSGFSRDEAGDTNNESSLQLQAQGDVLGFSAQLTADGEYNQNAPDPFDLNNINLRFNKNSPTGDLLGFLNATEIELGDITGTGIPLTSAQISGRGAQITNTPLGFVEDVNTFVLQDFAPVGWDVEVYRNGNLQAFDVVNANGEYVFEDLILQPGLNVFRILLFGPQGERQERVERFFLGGGLIRPGELYYDVQVLESGNALFKLGEVSQPDLASGNVRLQYGLNQYLSVVAGAYAGPAGSENRDESLWRLGLRGGYGRNYGQIDWVQGSDGQGLTGVYQRSVGKSTTLGAEFTQLEGVFAEDAGYLNQQSLTVNRELAFLARPLQLNLGYSREENLNNSITHAVNSTQATRLFGIALTHDISHEWQLNQPTRTLGALDFTKSINKHTLRGGVVYTPDINGWLRSARLSAQLQVWGDKQLNLALNHDFGDSSLTTLSNSLNIPVGVTNLQMNSSITNTGAASLGVGLALNFAPTLDAKKPFRLQPKGAGFGYGSVQVRVFVDENNNKTFDEFETPLANVKLRNGKNGSTLKTAHHGRAIFHNITPWQQVPLILEPESLPDIYYVSAEPKQVIVAHESFSGTIDFPIIRLGEIYGTVLSQAGSIRRQLANVPVELLDNRGTILETVHTEHDGYFIFQAKPLGDYVVRVADAESLGFKSTAPRSVTLTNKAPELGDVNFVIEQMNDTDIEPLPTLKQSNTILVY